MPDQAHDEHKFDAMLPAYERWAQPVSEALAAVVMRRIGLAAGMRVLDLGAGTGNLAVPAAALGCSVLAVDDAPGMIGRLRERLAPFPGSRAEQADMRTLDLEPASFDAVASLFCAAFMPDAASLFAMMVRLTKPGGTIAVANWTDEFGGPMFRVLAGALRALPADEGLATSPGVSRLLAAAELEGALRDAGCPEVEVFASEVDCPLPGPADFLDELDTFHRVVPAYGSVGPDRRVRLQELIEAEFQAVPVVDGRHVLPARAHIAIGRVGRAAP